MEHLDTPDLRAHVQKLMQDHHVPGLSVALVLNGNTSSFALGHASLNPPKPCTEETLFDIASSSKSLTATSVALLVYDEDAYPEIQWDTPMSKLLPDDFVTMEESYTKGITVEDILSHRTGIPSHDSSYLGEKARHSDNARSITRNLRNLAPSDPIRSKFIYNNLMFTIATHLIEDKSKSTFTEFLENRIFQPLGMHETSLQPRGAEAKGLGARIAIGHAWDSEKEEQLSFPLLNTTEDQGAGSIITTANDYLKWVKALMNCEGCITKEIQESLTTPRAFAYDTADYPLSSPELYTLGLTVSYYRGYKIVAHNGRIAGFGSRHFFLPNLNFGGVILGNAGTADDVATILSYELVDEVLKIPKAERTDWNEFEINRLAKQKAEYDEENSIDTVREKICPGLKNLQPQETPLSAYTGDFYNAGYKSFTIQVRENKLYSDASDRSCGFDLTFDHVCDQTKYIVHLRNLEDLEVELLAAEFVLEDEKAVRLGICIEPEIDEYIWFDRV